MKTFIYTVKEKNYPNELIKVYRVKKNLPELVGVIKIQRNSFKGYESEVMEYLALEKHIPARYTGYYNRMETKSFKIKGI